MEDFFIQFNVKKATLLVLALLVLLTATTAISAADNSTTDVSDVATTDNSANTQTSHDTSTNNDNTEATTSDSIGTTHSDTSTTTQSTSTTKDTNSNSDQSTSKVADSTQTSTQSTTSSSTEKQADTSQSTSTSQTSNSDNQISNTDSYSTNTSTTKDSTSTQSSTSSVKTNTSSIKELNTSTNTVSTNLVDEKTQLKTSTINADGSYTVNSYEDLYNTIEDIKTSGNEESYTIYLGDGTKNETFTVTGSNSYIQWGDTTSDTTRKLIIDGRGLVTIDGLESTKYFIEISAGYTLTLQNISIINYYAKDTSDGIINNYGTLNVVNSYFSDNYARILGVINNCGNLTVNSSTFIENRGFQNGVICSESSENAYIINSTFALNTAGEAGAAIAHIGSGKLYIINSIFTENEALGTGDTGSIQPEGGAIYCRNSEIIIRDSTFNLNSATATGQEGLGGAIYAYNSNLFINNSKFIQNTAVETLSDDLCEGGAIYLTRYSNCTINNSEFIENNAVLGGAIYVSSRADNLIINSSKFIENSAVNGGSIYNYAGNITINSSTFSENTAEDGGVIYNLGYNECTLEISNSEFTENSATGYGGAINTFGELTIKESTFKNNNAPIGGAVYSQPYFVVPIVTISKSEFTENSAENGGAIVNYAGEMTIKEDTIFKDNSATEDGGAIYNLGEGESYPATLTIENSEFYTNTATGYGGAIYNDEDGYLTLTGNTFEGNEGQYKDTIFTVVEITKMIGNEIIMSDYDIDTFDNIEIYSPIIDTTADPNADPYEKREDTIVYDISHPSGKETSEVITYYDGYDTSYDYTVNDGGVYTINIVYRDSDNYISYNIYSHDLTHIVLDSNIVATPGETKTINGYLYSTNDDPYVYDDYSNKKVTVYINGEQLKDKDGNPTQVEVDTDGHFEFEMTPVEGYNSIYVVYDGYIIDKTTYIAGSSNITGFTTNDHNAIITATPEKDLLNVTQSTNINGKITNLQGEPLEDTTIEVTVQISNGTTTTVTAIDGIFQYEFEPSTEGTYTFIFSCDDDYTAVSDPVSVTVVRTNTNIKIDTSNVKIGENRNITLTLQSDFGYNIAGAKLVVSVNGVNKQVTNVGNGIYTIKTGELTAGTYTVIASFEGDNTFYGTEKITTFKVSKLETKVSIDHLDNIVPGEEVTITGSLTLSDGTTPIPYTSLVVIINGEEYPEEVVTDESGHFSIPYTVPSNGQLDIVVLYRGSDIYENSYNEDVDTSDVPSGNRTNIPTTTTVGGIVGEFGETVNLTAIVLDEDGNLVPEGQVLFKINDVTVKDENGNILYADVVNGVARLPYTITNSPKNYTIMAVYQGTDTYLPSSSNYALLIVEASAKIPTTTIVDNITGQYGETVNLTATVYDEDGNLVDEGKLIFKINDVTLKDEDGNVIYVDVVDGVAKLPYTIINNPKNYTILAIYQGTDKYMESRSDYATLTVEGEAKNKIPTTTVVESITGQKGETVNLTATVYDEYGNLVPEGQVLFKLNDVTIKDEDGNILYADVIDGVAKLPYTITNSPKNYTLLAIYQGTDNYYSSRSEYSTLYVVNNDANTTTNIVVDDAIQQWGDVVKFTATITDGHGNPITGGKVVFKLNGVTIKDENGDVRYAQVVNGKAELYYTITNNVKDYTLTAVYSGYDTFEEARSLNATLTVTPRSVNITTDKINGNIKSGDNITFKATITESDTTYTDNGVVVFKINGKTIRDEEGNPIIVDVNNGIATLDYQIPVDFAGKEYNITAVYTNDNYLRAEANNTLTTVRSNVQTELNPITVSHGQNANIYMVLYDENGNQLERETKVAIKINGHTIIHMNTTAGVLNATIPASEITQTTNRIDVVLGENQGYYELRLNTTLKVN